MRGKKKLPVAQYVLSKLGFTDRPLVLMLYSALCSRLAVS